MPRRIRVVTSRGHKYAQEVEYRWNRVLRRGETRVVRTLGPLAPLRRPSQGSLSPAEIQLRLRIQADAKQVSMLSSPQRGPETVTNDARPLGTDPRRASETDVLEERSEKGSDLAGSGEGRFTFTGRAGLAAFDQEVEAIVLRAGRPLTRREVTGVVESQGIKRPNHRLSLRRHVSFALTRLAATGRVRRIRGETIMDRLRYSAPILRAN